MVLRVLVSLTFLFLLSSTARCAGSASEQEVRDFVSAVYVSWSKPNEAALRDLDVQYAATVTFYGKDIAKADLLRQKADFAKRWPTRDYEVDGGQVVRCSTDDRCTSDFTVAWTAMRATGDKKSTGTADVQLTVARSGDRWQITGETAKVLPKQRVIVAKDEKECIRKSPDNAALGNCLYNLHQRESAPLQSEACSSQTCAIKLPCKDGDSGRICATKDWSLEIKSNAAGYEAFITGPDGRVTKFTACGTCHGKDYEFGPLKTATFEKVGPSTIVLTVPRVR